VVEVNTKTVDEYKAVGISSALTTLAQWLERRQFRGTSGAFCITNELADYARALLPEDVPTWVTGNGFNADRTQLTLFDEKARKSLDIPVDDMVVVFLGSLYPWQGVDYLIETLISLQNVWLLVIGNGPERNKLEQLANQLGVDGRLRWLGWQEGAALQQLLGAVDVAVGTLALNRKGMSEAQALKTRHCLGIGLPIIIGYSDTLLDSDSPGVFYADNTSELVQRIQEIRAMGCTRDLSYRQQIRDFAVQRLSWATIAKQTSDFMYEAQLF
jgi:glycosyltransferase involved in cell wall biosynthesis